MTILDVLLRTLNKANITEEGIKELLKTAKFRANIIYAHKLSSICLVVNFTCNFF